MTGPNTTPDEATPERPADPFKPLGNETRLEILRVLYDHLQSTSREATLSYSTLRSEVGVTDKGNFNYHLRQLDGLFVERGSETEPTASTGSGTGSDTDTETTTDTNSSSNSHSPTSTDSSPDGYRLTFAGFEIAKVIDVDAWRSHEPCGPVVLDDPRENPVDTSANETDDGPTAQDPLTATYEDSVVEIRRGDDLLYAHAVRPTGAAARGMAVDELLDTASTLWRHTVEQLLKNICPYCHAPIERALEYTPDRRWEHAFSANCDECGSLGGSHVGIVAITHPEAIAFCWDHGLDLTSTRVWSLPFVDDDAVTVLSDEPRRVRLDITFETARLELVVSDDVRIVDTERVCRAER
ncbi:HTH domain protein [Natrialba magadii ATCC 43099]|uniref:HTH domain protein n=1 Tax=Natrialba magadii (strain ATCC 43099 / DSM 3394 / CCM 3739 / CIP 104546 / IAM 13178 / JCM 8861 / NBRC 102185 / NCIMB 2190 / MS3) TaxID=547559 RepID=D3SYX0_NATMM|nr:helix-turn-helix domain-containing protein [Natrialba magadii]ADD06162.1 HTH domain protein [Natrialba magadii ATCC 43099]ELY30839.1 hypothetical protein C500_07373 [Natrialba magadii ATCC 43099]